MSNFLKTHFLLSSFVFVFILFLTLPVFFSNYSYACLHVIPEINSVSPNPVSPNSLVSIYGRSFQSGGLQVVYEDSAGIELLVADFVNEGQINFNAPSRETVGKSSLYVHTCGGPSNTVSFNIENKQLYDYCKFKYDCEKLISPTPTPIKQVGCNNKKGCEFGYPQYEPQPNYNYSLRWGSKYSNPYIYIDSSVKFNLNFDTISFAL